MGFGAHGPWDGNAGRTFVASVQIRLRPLLRGSREDQFCCRHLLDGAQPIQAAEAGRTRTRSSQVPCLVSRLMPDARHGTRLRVSTPATVRVAVHAFFFLQPQVGCGRVGKMKPPLRANCRRGIWHVLTGGTRRAAAVYIILALRRSGVPSRASSGPRRGRAAWRLAQ